jgi:23S rRNA (uracil1939-C5)-methyltransferase
MHLTDRAAVAISVPMNELIEIRIDSIADSGEGVGRAEGKVFFVAHTAPGDLVSARPIREDKRWTRAELVELKEAGPGRVDPPCSLAGRCGGCQLQHISSEAEREAKLKVLSDSLERIGGLGEIPEIQFESSSEFAYRRRARFQGRSLAETVEMGFLAAGSHELVPQEKCLLLDEKLQTWVDAFRNQLAGSLPELFSFKAEFTLLEGDALQLLLRVESRVGEKVLAVMEAWDTPAPLHLSLRALEKQHSFREASGAPFLLETLKLEPQDRDPLEIRLLTRPGDFIQVNASSNQRLITCLLENLDLSETPWLMDLYAGSGNLTLPLALSGAKVMGVEENRSAVRSARRAFRENRAARARMKAGKVAKILPELAADGRKYRTVVLDPPREGAPELVDWLDPLDVQEIASLSCNPATLARDIKAWTQKGFQLEALHLFDFFPQTRHMECLAILKR